MSTPAAVPERWAAVVRQVQEAYERGDEAALAALLATPDARDLRQTVAEVTATLRAGVDRLGRDARLAQLAHREMPDARARLEHVLTLTEQAAHSTLDLVERSTPLAARAASESAVLGRMLGGENGHSDATPAQLRSLLGPHLLAVERDCRSIQGNLAQVLMAQGFQDLTGQILRAVIELVGELETALAQLFELSAPPLGQTPQAASGRGFGPTVPRAGDTGLGAQADVDDLIAKLGV